MSSIINTRVATGSIRLSSRWVFLLCIAVLWLTYLVTAVFIPFRGASPGPLYPLYTPYHYATGRSFVSNVFDISSLDFWMVVLGTVIICLSAIGRKWCIAISVPFGYLYGIILAVTGHSIFWSEGPGTYENNAWPIFTITYASAIALGLIWQLIIPKIHCRQQRITRY